MDEWLAIALAGALGGSLGTFMPSGTDILSPRPLRGWVESNALLGLLFHMVRNTALGGVASFVIWGLSNPNLEFTSSSITVGEIAAGIIVGGGGVGLLNNLFQQSARLQSKDEAIEWAASLLTADTEEEDGQSQ